MKLLLQILPFMFLLPPAFAQRMYEPVRGSEERKAHMELLHKEFDGKFRKQEIIFEVAQDSYRSDGLWAFITVSVYQQGGKPVDFTKSDYKEEWEEGFMDSNGINALLKKQNGKWKLIDHVDFPTDVPYGCWWKQYKAPKKLFPYTEPEKNCK